MFGYAIHCGGKGKTTTVTVELFWGFQFDCALCHSTGHFLGHIGHDIVGKGKGTSGSAALKVRICE